MHGLLYYVSLVNFELSCQYKQLTHLRIIIALRHFHLCLCIVSSLHCIFSCWGGAVQGFLYFFSVLDIFGSPAEFIFASQSKVCDYVR